MTEVFKLLDQEFKITDQYVKESNENVDHAKSINNIGKKMEVLRKNEKKATHKMLK